MAMYAHAHTQKWNRTSHRLRTAVTVNLQLLSFCIGHHCVAGQDLSIRVTTMPERPKKATGLYNIMQEILYALLSL